MPGAGSEANTDSNGDGDIEALIGEFLDDCRLRDLTERTVENYRSCLRVFFSTIAVPAALVGEHDLRDFLGHLKTEREVSNTTISRYFTALQEFYEFLIHEEHVGINPVHRFRRRYLKGLKRRHRSSSGYSERKLISVTDMQRLINSIVDTRDRAVVTLLAKTGIRRGELITLDIGDINWEEQAILLKPTKKRSNRMVFFDAETARVLKRWLITRQYHVGGEVVALFINERGGRLNRNGVYSIVTKYAERVGLHDPTSTRLEDKFTPHCCRHWFTTHLRRAGMQREMIKELRGDVRIEAMDIYYHIDREELKTAYLAYMPELGI